MSLLAPHPLSPENIKEQMADKKTHDIGARKIVKFFRDIFLCYGNTISMFSKTHMVTYNGFRTAGPGSRVDDRWPKEGASEGGQKISALELQHHANNTGLG